MTDFNKLRQLKAIRINAKALYIVSLDIEDVYDYLNAKIEKGYLTEDEADKMVESITNEVSEVYNYQFESIRRDVINLKNEEDIASLQLDVKFSH